jgi:NAD(P)H-flavin reductase
MLIPSPYRVSATHQETVDTQTLELVPLAGERISYDPGQFTMVYAFGAGEVPISISGDPGGAEALVHTIRAVGPTTETLCGLSVGEQVGIRGPFGHGWPGPERDGDDLLLVAGGLGLAPLRPMIYRALAERESFRRLVLLYGGREPDQLLFRGELDHWTEREDIDCDLIVDVAHAGWRGRVGVVPSLIERLDLDPPRTSALVCGPEVMMRYSAAALLELGVGPDRLHLSMERNMRCAVGHCGHCQWGSSFICRDGPVLDWETVGPRIGVREL